MNSPHMFRSSNFLSPSSRYTHLRLTSLEHPSSSSKASVSSNRKPSVSSKYSHQRRNSSRVMTSFAYRYPWANIPEQTSSPEQQAIKQFQTSSSKQQDIRQSESPSSRIIVEKDLIAIILSSDKKVFFKKWKYNLDKSERNHEARIYIGARSCHLKDLTKTEIELLERYQGQNLSLFDDDFRYDSDGE